MPDVKHEAFVDLEHALSDRLTNVFIAAIRPLNDRIVRAVQVKDFDTAHERVDEIDASKALRGQMQYIRTVLQAATLMGAKHVHPDVTKATVFQRPDRKLLDSAVNQLVLLVERNVTQQVKNAGHRAIEKARKRLYWEQDREVRIAKADFADLANQVRVRVNNGGKSMFSLGASGYVSRMRSYGMLSEMPPGDTYQIQAVLDDRTTDICRHLHGRVFTVSEGLAKIEAGLNSDDPNVWSALTPWPKDTSALPTNSQGLAEMGLQTPPYHPLCRTIVINVGRQQLVEGPEFLGEPRSEPVSILEDLVEPKVPVPETALNELQEFALARLLSEPEVLQQTVEWQAGLIRAIERTLTFTDLPEKYLKILRPVLIDLGFDVPEPV